MILTLTPRRQLMIDRHGRLVLVPSKVEAEDLFRHQRQDVEFLQPG